MTSVLSQSKGIQPIKKPSRFVINSYNVSIQTTFRVPLNKAKRRYWCASSCGTNIRETAYLDSDGSPDIDCLIRVEFCQLAMSLVSSSIIVFVKLDNSAVVRSQGAKVVFKTLCVGHALNDRPSIG